MRPILCAEKVFMRREDYAGDKQTEIALRESKANLRGPRGAFYYGHLHRTGREICLHKPCFYRGHRIHAEGSVVDEFLGHHLPRGAGSGESQGRGPAADRRHRSCKVRDEGHRKSGEEKFAHVDVTFIEFKEKPAILGSVTDLTERKLMEDALERVKRSTAPSSKTGSKGCSR